MEHLPPAFVALCPECHFYFGMEPLKGDYKKCPGCGERVRWRALRKWEAEDRAQAVAMASELNGRSADTGAKTLRELLSGGAEARPLNGDALAGPRPDPREPASQPGKKRKKKKVKRAGRR
jgi:hypothetical protein